jgi:hypothetical protein
MIWTLSLLRRYKYLKLDNKRMVWRGEESREMEKWKKWG